MGIPVSAFFEAGAKIAIVIGCSDYAELRNIEGKEGFQDIPEAQQDIKIVKAGLKRLGFSKTEI